MTLTQSHRSLSQDNISLRTVSPVSSDVSHDESDTPRIPARFKVHLQSFVFAGKSPEADGLTMPSSKVNTKAAMPVVSKRITRAKAKAASSNVNVQTHAGRKRAAVEDQEIDVITKPAKKKKRSTTKQRSATDPHSPINNLVDSLRPGLTLVFIGLNPGLKTAETGHAYAHPSNLFWKLLYKSGVTLRRHDPSETRDLMDLYSIGNTNICARPTRSGDGLSKQEQIEGADILEAKIKKFRPQAVCIVGKGIWETIYKAKTGKPLKTVKFEYGWQDQSLWLGRIKAKDGALEWQGARTFVATTTSGLAAGMKPDEKLAIWKPLGKWFCQHRRPELKTETKAEVEHEVKPEINNEENIKPDIKDEQDTKLKTEEDE